MDKGKGKMSEYKHDHFDGNESTHSLDRELGGFNVPIEPKKALISENEKLRIKVLTDYIRCTEFYRDCVLF